MSSAEDLDDHERRLILAALESSRGSYSADRAAQLSGIPRRTVYYWAQQKILVPDHYLSYPKTWSYRDLVLLRLVAFLRRHRVEVSSAAALAMRFRAQFSAGNADAIETHVSAAQGDYEIGPAMYEGAITGQRAFDLLANISGHFDVMIPLEKPTELHRIYGPNLVRPSARTSISPWILSGEPVIRGSRISTATVAALHQQRGHDAESIVRLYPRLSIADVEDALALETSLRSVDRDAA